MPKSASGPKVYVDTCIYINVIKREPGLWADSLKVLLAAERGDIRLVASTLLLAEIGSWNGTVDPISRDQILSGYLENLPVEWAELDLFTTHEARTLCDRYRMRGADAVHLATAIRRKADYLVTRDKGFPTGPVPGTNLQVTPPITLWNPTLEDAHIDMRAQEESLSLQQRQPSEAPPVPRPQGPARGW
ncbi:type II toxin-antitoxin system VapC family toxin [Actinoplanes sp. CA-252034]|uniref:type II toxin-antitoxin system VapC family toxin n=1 Tax=Actinoplanes sp. CA-252034 TaxID=3239906 RepID=UPI003D999CF3